jgi:hypothetical protein
MISWTNLALDPLPQTSKHSWHEDNNRDPILSCAMNNVSWIECVVEVNLAAEELWHKHAHELTKDVTQRNQHKKAKRMNQRSPTAVFVYLALEREQIGEDISVRQHHAFRS